MQQACNECNIRPTRRTVGYLTDKLLLQNQISVKMTKYLEDVVMQLSQVSASSPQALNSYCKLYLRKYENSSLGSE